MLASATVRLYKINPSTKAYEVQAQGGPLGCVIFGSGLQNQILVYNAQVIIIINISWLPDIAVHCFLFLVLFSSLILFMYLFIYFIVFYNDAYKYMCVFSESLKQPFQ